LLQPLLAAIILLLFGIEQIVAGIFLYKRSKYAHIGLGISVIILSSLVITYPLATATLVVFLSTIVLLFSAVSSVIAGLRGEKRGEKNGWNDTTSKGSRALSIGAGALAIVLSIMIMTSPMLGIIFAGIVIG